MATYSVYDAAGNLVDVYQPPVLDTDPGSSTNGQTVDAAGNELSQTDPKGNLTRWTYDERGNKLTHALPGLQQESWTYDQYNRVVTHVDFNGNTAWEVYANAPQWGSGTVVGNDPAKLIAEYRYTGSFTPPTQASGTRPWQTTWQERTEYVYDANGQWDMDPAVGDSLKSGLPTALSGGEQTGLGRVAEVQEWTTKSGTPAITDFTHTTYDAATGQPATITSTEGVINYTYDPATGQKVRMWTGTDPAHAT